MVEQLDRVLGVMALTNVSIGITPAIAGLGAHTQTAFWIFDDNLVKVETLTAALDITRPGRPAQVRTHNRLAACDDGLCA
jgi:hypothetical protein